MKLSQIAVNGPAPFHGVCIWTGVKSDREELIHILPSSSSITEPATTFAPFLPTSSSSSSISIISSSSSSSTCLCNREFTTLWRVRSYLLTLTSTKTQYRRLHITIVSNVQYFRRGHIGGAQRAMRSTAINLIKYALLTNWHMINAIEIYIYIYLAQFVHVCRHSASVWASW